MEKSYKIIRVTDSTNVITVYIEGNVPVELPRTLFVYNKLPKVGDSIFFEQIVTKTGYTQTEVFINDKKLEKKSSQ